MADDLARQAAAKQQRGEKLTRDEQRALARAHAEGRERIGREFCAAVPQKVYREWVGRQTKQLQDLHRTYGLPVSGATLNLAAVLKAFHDLVAENAAAIASQAGEGTTKQKLEAERLEQARMKTAELRDNERLRRGELVYAAQVTSELARCAKLLSRLEEWFRKQPTLTGAQAAEELGATIDAFGREHAAETETDAPPDAPA